MALTVFIWCDWTYAEAEDSLGVAKALTQNDRGGGLNMTEGTIWVRRLHLSPEQETWEIRVLRLQGARPGYRAHPSLTIPFKTFLETLVEECPSVESGLVFDVELHFAARQITLYC